MSKGQAAKRTLRLSFLCILMATSLIRPKLTHTMEGVQWSFRLKLICKFKFSISISLYRDAILEDSENLEFQVYEAPRDLTETDILNKSCTTIGDDVENEKAKYRYIGSTEVYINEILLALFLTCEGNEIERAEAKIEKKLKKGGEDFKILDSDPLSVYKKNGQEPTLAECKDVL